MGTQLGLATQETFTHGWILYTLFDLVVNHFFAFHRVGSISALSALLNRRSC
jgi:hypothetical protein